MEFLIGICSTIVREIAMVTVAPIGRQAGYLFHYHRNMNELGNKIQDLNAKKTSIDREVEQDRRNNKVAEEIVIMWQNEVEKICKDADDIQKLESNKKVECSCSGSFLNLVLRRKLSRKAKKKAELIASKIQKVDTFGSISFTPIISSSFENRDFQEFGTRTVILKKITDALKDDSLGRIGVHGMAGIGKTTLVNEVARKVKEEGLFSEVIMVTVSQSFSLQKIQKEIATKLGLELSEGDMLAREKLQHRFKCEDKLLIILDDIWEKIKLEEAGICFKEDQRGCKILLVSRYQYVLHNDMVVEKEIEVEVLSKEEALSLFNKFAGNRSEQLDYRDLAAAIVGQCGGLPIAIVPIASALKDRQFSVWSATFNKLKNSIKDGNNEAYSCVRTSYEFLGSEEKMILLLCAQHEEDADISVESLMNIYAASCNLFLNYDALHKVRDSVDALVDNLKGYHLLLNGDRNGTVKLHDVTRQIMVSIAMEDKGMYCFENTGSLKSRLNKGELDDSIGVSLLGCNFDKFPDGLPCSKLNLFIMNHDQGRYISPDSEPILFPNGVLEEATELRALCLRSIIFKLPLPLSTPCSLKNLQTLLLQNCVLKDIAFIGELENLVVLDLSNSKFEHLPEQVGKLIHLRQLNLNNCTDLEVIPPNVISSLVQLEEFYMDCVYIKWGMEATNGEGRNASLVELRDLQRLRALHLYVLDASVLPQDMFVRGKLRRYNIIVGSRIYGRLRISSRLLHLKLNQRSQVYYYGFQMLIEGAEVLYLGALPGVSNVVYQLDADGFPQLKELNVEKNDEVQCIVESTGEIQPYSAFENLERLQLLSLQNLERICYGRFTAESFGKLRSISARSCDKLKNALSYTVARRLEEIIVEDCSVMEEIVYCESEDLAATCDEVEFSVLRSLTLKNLPNLIQFFHSELGTTNCHASSPVTPSMPLFNEKVAFPSLEFLLLRRMDFSELWPNGLPSISFMQNLKRLYITDCQRLKYLFPFAIVESLTQLEHLSVTYCEIIEEIIKEWPGSSRKILLPKLRSLDLERLQSLKQFCGGDCDIECESLLEINIRKCPQLNSFTSTEIGAPLFTEKEIAFPRLQNLNVVGCESLKHLLPYEMARSLLQLQSLKVDSCSNMEEVILVKEADEEQRLTEILFPQLKYLELSHLWILKRFSSADCVQCLPSVIKLNINNGPVEISELWPMYFSEKVAAFDILSNMMFRNLKELEIKGRNCLPFIAAESLQQLKKLTVSSCNVMEHVITKAIGEDGKLKKLTFLKLESLELQDLTELKSFCEGADYIECPSLLKLKIYYCGKLRTFLPTLAADEQEVEVRESVSKQPLFNQKVAFPRLEKLFVIRCESLTHLLSYEVARSLSQLESLEVMSCTNMEEMVMVKEVDGEQSLNDISFQKLKYLVVQDLPMLDRLSSADCIKWSFPSLINLKMLNGDKYKTQQIGPTMLRPAMISGYMSSESYKKVVFFDILSKMTFRDLQVLEIEGHNNWPYLMSFAMAESLQKLKNLKISGCNVMEHVINKAIGEDGKLKKISFLKLESLELHFLRELKSFCEGADYIECPSLLRLKIYQCRKLKTFIPHSASTPTLTADEREVEVRESVSQQPLFNEKVVFTNLEELEIYYSPCDENNEVWPRQSSTILFPKLRSESGSGASLFNIHRHENLESISLSGFNVENIWQHGELGDAEEHGNKTLQRLRKLSLWNLPKLMHLFDNVENVQFKPQTFQTLEALSVFRCARLETLAMSSYFSFKNLTDVEISNCPGMIDLFDSSTAKSLVQLTRMSIYACSQMRQVLRTDKEDEAETGIVFHRLRFLAFSRLPSLESFHRGNDKLDFPNLGKIVVIKCPKMSRFSHGTINTPNLKNIITKVDLEFWLTMDILESAKPMEKLILEGDLNRSIRRLWKQKETERHNHT